MPPQINPPPQQVKPENPNGSPDLATAALLQLRNQATRLTTFLGSCILDSGASGVWQKVFGVGVGSANEINEIILSVQGGGTVDVLIQIVFPGPAVVGPPSLDVNSQFYYPALSPGTTILELSTAVPGNAAVYLKATLAGGQTLSTYFSGLGAAA